MTPLEKDTAVPPNGGDTRTAPVVRPAPPGPATPAAPCHPAYRAVYALHPQPVEYWTVSTWDELVVATELARPRP